MEAVGWRVSSPTQDSGAAARLHQHILELPRITLVDVLFEKTATIRQRRPIAVGADDGAEIRPADLEIAPEIDFVGLDDTGVRILDRPNESRQHGDADLQARRGVVLHE